MALISGIFAPNGDYKPKIYFFAGKNITNIFFVIFLESISGARGDDHLEVATATRKRKNYLILPDFMSR